MTRQLMRGCFLPLVSLGALLLTGCASSQYAQGKALLAEEEYAAATKALQAALVKEPQSTQILVDLAEAFYHQEELAQAESCLAQVRSLDPDNGDAILLVGLIQEKRGDREAAIAAYRMYTRVSRLSQTRKMIEARLEWLIREQIGEETKRALAREAMLEVAEIPDNAIAVAPFRNVGSDRSLDPLQTGLAEMMVTDLSQVRSLQVVERLRMQEMMREIGLGQSGAVDPSTTPRLGRLVGASQVVNGGFAGMSDEHLRLDVSVAGVATGDVRDSQSSGPLAKLFRLQKELTFSLIEEMGIELTDQEREAIQEVPTENLLAFMAYSRGLDLEDQGRTEEAEAEFEKAVGLDPGFGAARIRRERAEGFRMGATSRRALEKKALAIRGMRAPGVPDMRRPPRNAVAQRLGEVMAPQIGIGKARGTLGRLATTGMHAGAGFMPAWKAGSTDLRKPIPQLLREMEKITFRRDEAVLDIVVPVD